MEIKWHIYKRNEGMTVSLNWLIAKSHKGGYNLYHKTEVWTDEYSYNHEQIEFIGHFITLRRAKDHAQLLEYQEKI